MILYNLLAIADKKAETYISEWYKNTDKNKKAMEKEIERLNKNENGRYYLATAFKSYKWETTFDKNNY